MRKKAIQKRILATVNVLPFEVHIDGEERGRPHAWKGTGQDDDYSPDPWCITCLL